MQKGYFHVYTGNGKGKTTASFGLAVRALCAGKNVAIGQFIKAMKSSETKIASIFNGSIPGMGKVVVEQFGRGCCIGRQIEEADREYAQRGWEICQQWLQSPDLDVVVLDELNNALHLGLLPVDEVVEALANRRPELELVVSGRNACQQIIEMADLVTEMREVKHYFRNGVKARLGIEF